MNKKLLIASFFATIMLIVPFTSVAGSDELIANIEEYPDEEVMQLQNIIPNFDNIPVEDLEQFFTELQLLINIILQYFGHIPEIAEIVQKIVFTIDNGNPIKCGFWGIMMYALLSLTYTYHRKLYELGIEVKGIFLIISLSLCCAFVWSIGAAFVYCDIHLPPDPFNMLQSNTYMNSNEAIDISSLIELSQSYEIDVCPCSQPANI